ncbi:MAG: hydantoinase/oxoprolinase family protein [Nitrososphaerota archaeon]|nr:hydantoinase/oxoprolinase family protein [Nitrososphaerota archaeon]MDG7024806.1 hydantoinase/oxoprolinase family protein [Nitrososphaerota archaeon]
MPAKLSDSVIGVDVGGTFTDIIVGGPDGLTVLKLPTTAAPASAVLRGLRRMGKGARRARLISHATTLATNALITHSGLARTALITNEGFRDILEIGRQRRPEVYSLDTRRPAPLVERRDRLTVRCRVGADGSLVAPLDPRDAASLAEKVSDGEYESVAVCFLNSYLNPIHEDGVRRALLRKRFRGHISLSSEVDREYREYERTSTTVVNAALSPLMSGYLSSLSASLRRSRILAPVYVMNSDGGASTIAFASSHPVVAIESGPAAGVVASKLLARRLSMPRVLTFDMGGTTAKAGTVIDGEPEITNEFEAAGSTHSGRSIRGSGYPVRGEFIDLAEVSAGGGTVAWADEAGELKVGPRSAGSSPGPACYGFGGTEPTVTDANVALGRLNPRFLLGGAMKIHRGLALRSLRKLSRRLDLRPQEVASGIIRLVNFDMSKAISMVTVERGHRPEDFTMFAFGGGGPLQACDLAEGMGVSEIVVPVHAGLFSAYGLLAGELTRTFTEPVLETEPRLKGRFRELENAAARQLRREGFRHSEATRFVECRYLGQSHELLLPFVGDESIRRQFDARHAELYGYSLPDSMEVVNIRVRASVRRPSIAPLRSGRGARPKRPTERKAWIGGKMVTARVVTREALAPGESGRGPSIIEEYDSTLVVNSGWTWTAEGYGTRVTR